MPLTLNGWNEIASALRQTVPTVKRWEQEEGLPIHRTGKRRVSVFAFPTEILEWLRLHEFQIHHSTASSSPDFELLKRLRARNKELRSELRSLLNVSRQRVTGLRNKKEAVF